MTFAAKLQPLHTERFEAFLVRDMKWHDGDPLPLTIDASSLEEAAAQASLGAAHKATFLVKHTDEFTGRVTLHFYTVKRRSKPNYVRRPGFAHAVQEHPLYAEALFVLALTEEVSRG